MESAAPEVWADAKAWTVITTAPKREAIRCGEVPLASKIHVLSLNFRRLFDRASSGRPEVFSGRRSFLWQGFLKGSLLNILLFLPRFDR